MSVGSGVSKVSNDTHSLYKLLGMNDKYHGVVEKDSLNENYNEWHDINKDGKIIEAEAKVSLLYLPGISPKVKKRFALTEAERKVLAVYFQEAFEKTKAIEDRFAREMAVFNLTIRMAKAGLFDEALETARTMEISLNKADVFRLIALEMDAAGSDKNDISNAFHEAMETARLLDCDPQALELTEIASEIDESETDKVFQEALEAARGIENPGFQADAISLIALKMAQAGKDKSEISRLFQEALGVAETIESSDLKASAICDIAFKMSQAKQNKGEIRSVLNEALKIARTVNDKYAKAKDISDIALRMAISVLDGKKAFEIFYEALKTTKAIVNPVDKARAIKYIVLEMVEAGMSLYEISIMFNDIGLKLPK